MPTTATPAAAPTAASTPEAKPKRGVSLAGIAKTTAKAPGAKSYPTLPASDEVQALVADLIDNTAKLEALEGSVTIAKAELTTLARQHFFSVNHGRAEIPSSIAARDASDREVLVTFQNRYKAAEAPALASVLTEEQVDQFFRQSFVLKVDGDKIPPACAQDLIQELSDLFARHNASDALSAKETFVPTPEFHTLRHTKLTPEQNLQLELVAPIIPMVKTKGRKKE